ncbi:MAG: hypothetical protein ACLQEI_00565, partial [Terriglobales bacterium]
MPQYWGRKGSLYKANNRVQDQKREYYPNEDTLLLLLHLFTIGTPLETISHTPGKILSSVP